VKTLIVEDSVVTRDAFKQRLNQLGCTIVGATGNAHEALALFRSLRPQLVTLDLVLPTVEGMTAQSFFRLLREEAPDVAIIVISGQRKETEEAELMRLGALAYFQKPFINFDSLSKKLTQIFPELGTVEGSKPSPN
jgi:two-component system chemotaxis response regulator CheY